MAEQRVMIYGIGIDTGGTYTDSVVVDLASNAVLSKSKALTTPHDLRLGIDASLSGLDRRLFKQVRIVALSSTLATNSVVESKGARVGLIVSVPRPDTFSLPASLPCVRSAAIAGAHDRHGQAVAALDTAVAAQIVDSFAPDVDAFAVSSYFSIYNPAHEIALRELIARRTDKPVVCAHELSGAVGMLERAATAALNARLLPLMRELISAVDDILELHDIAAPLMVVKGDGSIASATACRERPVETVLSGPAASVYGACRLSGIDDALVVDMGGTTTDIALVAGGRAAVNIRGARVGGWQTKVQAVDMWTVGLGGDSRILVQADGSIVIGPRRAVPLSLAASRCPDVVPSLQELLATPEAKLQVGQRQFFTLLKRPVRFGSQSEEALLDALDGKVLSLAEIQRRIGPFVDIASLAESGAIIETALTPTDVLHAQGELDTWDAHAARLAVELAARRAGMEPQTLIERARTEIHLTLARETLAKALHAEEGFMACWSAESHGFLDRLLRLPAASPVRLRMGLKLPVIAVGAPVGAHLPEAARLLGAELVIPPHAEVANAFGAVTGKVLERVESCIRPLPSPREGYVVVGPVLRTELLRLEDAVQLAQEQAADAARQLVASRGGCDIRVDLERCELTAPLAEGWGDPVLIEVRIAATAEGSPAACPQRIVEPSPAIA